MKFVIIREEKHFRHFRSRLGETYYRYYIIVNKFARKIWGKNVDLAYQYIFQSYSEDSIEYINKNLNNIIRTIKISGISHFNYPIYILFKNGKIKRYYEYDEQIMEKFPSGIKRYKIN